MTRITQPKPIRLSADQISSSIRKLPRIAYEDYQRLLRPSKHAHTHTHTMRQVTFTLRSTVGTKAALLGSVLAQCGIDHCHVVDDIHWTGSATVNCTAAEFGQFIILRNLAGMQNRIADLKAAFSETIADEPTRPAATVEFTLYPSQHTLADFNRLNRALSQSSLLPIPNSAQGQGKYQITCKIDKFGEFIVNRCREGSNNNGIKELKARIIENDQEQPTNQENEMKFLHREKDGKEILIPSMGDSHLKATIGLIVETVTKKVGLLANEQFAKAAKLYAPQMQTQDSTSNTDPERLRKIALESLAPYVLEAALRGLDVTGPLQELLERKEALPDFVAMQQLPALDVGDEEDF